eukprot:4250418-Pleurochrysis_carterae.AAC.1
MSVYDSTVVFRLQEVEPFRRLVERAHEATFLWCVLLLPAVRGGGVQAPQRRLLSVDSGQEDDAN